MPQSMQDREHHVRRPSSIHLSSDEKKLEDVSDYSIEVSQAIQIPLIHELTKI